jgi:glycosyltransferase involved in cell wall biosynthesis
MGEDLEKKTIVISAVNFFEGGPLTILNNNLSFVNKFLSDEYFIIALVHKKELFDLKKFPEITFMEFPKSRSSYLIRLYLEYFHFNALSKKWKPYLWLSLHDITPNVQAEIRAVYCHNPSPFKPKAITDLFFQPTLFFFSLFYKLLYQINIKKNDYVIVQQIWLKEAFVKLFDLKNSNVVVSYPENGKVLSLCLNEETNSNLVKTAVFTFFYPALARPFKNFEIIGEAIKLLMEKGIANFKVVVTMNGEENNYAKHIFKKYSKLKPMEFVGMLSFEAVKKTYAESDALLFPSTLETWGLPITEFKDYCKPILLSKLPYAYETLGDYNKACFFDPLYAADLAQKMELLMNGNLEFDKTSISKEPVLNGWSELFDKILKK